LNSNFYEKFYEDCTNGGQELLLFKNLESLKKRTSEETVYCRGITVIGDDLIAIGTSNGTIYLFQLLIDTSDKHKLVGFKKELTSHDLQGAIFDLASSYDGTVLCASDTFGNIFILDFNKSLNLKYIINSSSQTKDIK
jgi:hypothetical protein